ncbi:MAG: hypothetical protein D4R44_08125 [Actinobacteria bacterium]|nr:MAG: hypothetical protein D4R44_08125 [Actinomycetota bacterium]
MASELQSSLSTDFSKGENTVVSPYLVGPKQVLQAVNFILDEHGSLRVRDGTLLQTTAPDINRAVVKLHDLAFVSGTVQKLAIQKGVSAGNTLYDRGTTPWTSKGSFSTSYDVPDMLTFTDKAIIFNGYESIRSWDGTTFAASTGTPPDGGKHGAVYLSTLWAGNTKATTTSTEGKSSLRSTDVNNPNSWPAANQAFISKDDGQEITGMGLFTISETGVSPIAALVVFKDFSAYQVIGLFGASQFAIQKLKSDMGCVAGRSIQFCSGFGIIRLTHRGFALFDGTVDILISEEERPRLFGRDDYSGIDWSNVGLSYAAQVQNPPLYICVCPVAGVGPAGALSRMFVYDLVRKAWTICTFNNYFSTVQLILNQNALPVVLGGDIAGTGAVRRLFYSDADDDGFPVQWTLKTRPVFAGSPMNRAYFRRLLMKVFKMTALSQITVQFFFGPTQIINRKQIPIGLALAPFSGYGIDPYGTSGYGSEPAAQNQTDVDLNFDIGVKANNCLAVISGQGPGRIRGLEWHYKAMAKTRSTLSA